MGSKTAVDAAKLVDKRAMQQRLFSELSAMFGREVPLYDKSLLVDRECNSTVCALLSKLHQGFSISEQELDAAGSERHGAIRIGTPEEYRWVAGFFDCFGMLPHGFYDMTSLGGKSQPIIATAFRSVKNPEHRVFCSLLMIDSFDAETRRRIEELLSRRKVFSDRAKELVTKNEEQGGLDEADADELIREATTRIFKWAGKAHDHKLYKELCDVGFKIAADIACFESHHLNHLTPNTLCMDLYTSAMKFCMGEMDAAAFRQRAASALNELGATADDDYMRLHFRHLSQEQIDSYKQVEVTAGEVEPLVEELARHLMSPQLDLSKLQHSGFKDFTEGPPADTPILLRQDSYKALTEPVTFYEADGNKVETVHTARFGEIEQRFYATTEEGRALYDRCLARAEADREKDQELVKRDFAEYERKYAEAFAEIPKRLSELIEAGLVYACFSASSQRNASAEKIETIDVNELLRSGYLRRDGLRYEDFLPFSAAGIFASNLGQYGTKTAAETSEYSQSMLEEIMGRRIIDPNITYRGEEARSLLIAYAQLGLLENLPAEQRAPLESAVDEADRLIGVR